MPRRDRMTNVGRRGWRMPGPCPTCAGSGALLAAPGGAGRVLPAPMVVPHPRAWLHLPVAPCPVCGQSGFEPEQASARAVGAVWS